MLLPETQQVSTANPEICCYCNELQFLLQSLNMSREDRLEASMPARIAKLAKDDRGYPITYIAAFINGKADLGIQDYAKVLSCVREWRCHVCGEKLGKLGYFIAYEPIAKRPRFLDPAIHKDCALYSLKVCPYLANPSAKHR